MAAGSDLGQHHGGEDWRNPSSGKRTEEKGNRKSRMNLMNFGNRETMTFWNCFSREPQSLNLTYQRKQGHYHPELLKRPGYRFGSSRTKDVVLHFSALFFFMQAVERQRL